jgi:hypothetical protein
LPRGEYNGLYIELKVEKNKTSQSQDMWFQYLSQTGYKAVVCYGFEEAQKAISDYIKKGV